MIANKKGHDHQHALIIPKFENFDHRNVVGAYMNNLGWFLKINVVNLEFVMVQIYLNASDYSLKFHVPKLPYTIASLLTFNLNFFR